MYAVACGGGGGKNKRQEPDTMRFQRTEKEFGRRLATSTEQMLMNKYEGGEVQGKRNWTTLTSV